MCGIVGAYFFSNRDMERFSLEPMMKSLYHRGPDAEGRYIGEMVHLGFRRLSIIDTTFGNQPLYSEKKDVVLVGNGEIYNYKELKAELVAKGHSFSTGSDIEVILHLYEESGQDLLVRLNGMFAFALYDAAKDIILIARDRVGIKPLYIYKNRDVLLFSSEIKGILASGICPTEEEGNVLMEYVAFRSLCGGRTFFRNIRSMAPGTYLLVTGNRCVTKSYWINQQVDPSMQPGDIERALTEAIASSVERQMMSDVPLGTMMSGGVDSSLVSAIASRHMPRINTFTIGFHEMNYDETEQTKYLGKLLDLKTHSIYIDDKSFFENLAQCIWIHDEPLTHANSVMIYLLCQYARQYVKVLLTGEGADEFFGGYPRYYAYFIAGKLHGAGPLGKFLVGSAKAILRDHRFGKIRDVMDFTPEEGAIWNASFVSPEKLSWLCNGIPEGIASRRAEVYRSVGPCGNGRMERLLKFDQNTYLLPILARQDKMSMGASIESRVPLLDNQVIDLANTIPYARKVKYLTPKYLLRKVATPFLPKGYLQRRKIGFGVPFGKWLNGGHGRKYIDMLRDEKGKFERIDPRKIDRICNEHVHGIANHEDCLWPIVNYMLWRDIYIKGSIST